MNYKDISHLNQEIIKAAKTLNFRVVGGGLTYKPGVKNYYYLKVDMPRVKKLLPQNQLKKIANPFLDQLSHLGLTSSLFDCDHVIERSKDHPYYCIRCRLRKRALDEKFRFTSTVGTAT